MRLTVVGPAPAYTRRPGRMSSCYLVRDGGTAVALDLGQGSFAALAQHLDPADLSAVLVSHLHADHFVDLVPLRHYLKYAAGGRAVAVRGPRDLPNRLDGLDGEPGFMPPLAFVPLTPGSFDIGGLHVEAGHVRHIPDAYAFRVAASSAARGIVYSGDCEAADDLLPLIRAGDVLLCEAAYGVGPEAPIHLTAAQAASAARRGGASRLVLTHVLDGHAADDIRRAAATEFDGPIELAEPGLEVEVS